MVDLSGLNDSESEEEDEAGGGNDSDGSSSDDEEGEHRRARNEKKRRGLREVRIGTASCSGHALHLLGTQQLLSHVHAQPTHACRICPPQVTWTFFVSEMFSKMTAMAKTRKKAAAAAAGSSSSAKEAAGKEVSLPVREDPVPAAAVDLLRNTNEQNSANPCAPIFLHFQLLQPALVYQDIRSFLLGSAEAVQSKDGRLSRADYLVRGRAVVCMRMGGCRSILCCAVADQYSPLLVDH